MNKRKDAESNFDIVKPNKNESFISPSRLVLIIQEQLEEIEKTRKINDANRILNQQEKKAKEELEEFEAQLKSKQLQLHQQTEHNNRLKLAIQSRNRKIQKLSKEIEKRDRIFDFCHNNNNGEENQQIFLDTSNGNRIFEFWDKQTIPFTIKSERLSPVSHEESTADIEIEPVPELEYYCDSDINESISSKAEEVEEDVVQSPGQNIVTSESLTELNHDIVTIQHDTSETNNLPHNFEELPLQKEKDEENKEQISSSFNTIKSDKTSKFIPIKLQPRRWCPKLPEKEISPSPQEQQVQSNSNQNELISPQHQTQQQESSVADYNYAQYYQYCQDYQNYYTQWQNYAYYYAYQQQQQQLYQNEWVYFEPPPQQSSDVLTTDNFNPDPTDNVLSIPEILRYNFGFSEDSELCACPIGLQFWFDPEYSKITKLFIKLYDDIDQDWRVNKYFVVIEQIGVRNPRFHFLKYHEMLEKLEKIQDKRIWLDLRNFNSILGMDDEHNKNIIFKTETFSSITHFSFGLRIVQTSSECASALIFDSITGVKWKTLLKFISKRLVNLEYLSVNNNLMLISDYGSNKKSQISKKEIPSLTTIRLVHSSPNFPLDFISSLLKMSPNLQNLFGLPLHFLEGMNEKKIRNGIIDLKVVRSLFINKDFYFTKDGTLNYVNHLSLLSEQNFWNSLQELDCRTLFLPGNQSTLDICHHWLSQTLSHHRSSLKVLKLQPFSSSPSSSLIIPRLENLTTFKFYLSRKLDTQILFFFSTGSVYDPTKFPSLTTVEIILELKGIINKGGNNHSYPSSSYSIPYHPPARLFLQHFPRNIFQPGISFNSVTDLKLHGFNVLECMKDVSELFPNIQILRLYDILLEICEVLPTCFTLWPGLLQLHLNVDTNTRFGNLDNVLLGTSGEHVEILRTKNPEVQEREIDKLSNSSICQLKELQLFKIVLRSGGNEKTENQLPIMTEIGARVLSKFGSQLKVQIAFEEKMSLQEKNLLITSLHPLRSFPCLAPTYSIEI